MGEKYGGCPPANYLPECGFYLWLEGPFQKTTQTQGSYKPWFPESPLSCDLNPGCTILVFMWFVGPICLLPRQFRCTATPEVCAKIDSSMSGVVFLLEAFREQGPRGLGNL